MCKFWQNFLYENGNSQRSDYFRHRYDLNCDGVKPSSGVFTRRNVIFYLCERDNTAYCMINNYTPTRLSTRNYECSAQFSCGLTREKIKETTFL